MYIFFLVSHLPALNLVECCLYVRPWPRNRRIYHRLGRLQPERKGKITIMLLVILKDMQFFSISMKISGNLVMSSLEVIVKFYKRKKMAICSIFLFLVQNVRQGCFKISSFETGIHVLILYMHANLVFTRVGRRHR